MLILNPRTVRFGAAAWEGVTSIAIDRLPQKHVEEWSDAGPYAVFADVPEQRTRLTVRQELTRDDLASPRPGEQASLTFCTSPTASDAARRRLAATAVVLEIRHEVSLKRGAIRTITLAAISQDGATDPIAITDAF
jgi:hypothetical protein